MVDEKAMPYGAGINASPVLVGRAEICESVASYEILQILVLYGKNVSLDTYCASLRMDLV